MGLYNSPDIVKEKMNELFNGLDYVKTYIDDLLITTNNFVEDHIAKLDEGQNKVIIPGFKMNAEKFFFARNYNQETIAKFHRINLLLQRYFET